MRSVVFVCALALAGMFCLEAKAATAKDGPITKEIVSCPKTCCFLNKVESKLCNIIRCKCPGKCCCCIDEPKCIKEAKKEVKEANCCKPKVKKHFRKLFRRCCCGSCGAA